MKIITNFASSTSQQKPRSRGMFMLTGCDMDAIYRVRDIMK